MKIYDFFKLNIYKKRRIFALIIAVITFLNTTAFSFDSIEFSLFKENTHIGNNSSEFSNIDSIGFSSTEIFSETADFEDKKLTLYRKCEIAKDKYARADEIINQLQSYGFDFDCSALLFTAVCEGIFSVEEAMSLYEMCEDDTSFLDKISEFSEFARLFNVKNEVQLNNLTTSTFETRNKFDSNTIESCLELQGFALNEDENVYTVNTSNISTTVLASTMQDIETKFINATSMSMFQKAKQLLLEGENVEDIKDAVSISAVTGIEPNVILNNEENYLTNLLSSDISTASQSQLCIAGAELMTLTADPEWDPSLFIQSPTIISFDEDDSINMYTGGVRYETNLVNIPGRSGLDLVLNLRYNSDEAKHGIEGTDSYVHFTPQGGWEELRHYTNFNTKNMVLYDMGIGWSYDLPYFWNNELYIPGVGKYTWNGETLDDYYLDDIMIKESPEDSLIPDWLDISSLDYIVWLSSGITLYFKDGHIVAESDRFGNHILFSYNGYLQYNAFGSYKLSSICDSNGLTTNFEYSIFQDEKNITITTPDAKVTTLCLKPSIDYVDTDNKPVIGTAAYVLYSLSTPDGGITYFDYKNIKTDYNYLGDLYYYNPDTGETIYPEKGTNYYSLLTKITHPSGAETCYEYQHYMWTDSPNYTHYYYMGKRWISENENIYDEVLYSNYYLIDENGTRTNYSFDAKGKVKKKELYKKIDNSSSNKLLVTRIAFEYNDKELIEKVTTTKFFEDYSQELIQMYEYDDMGNLTESWSEFSDGAKENPLFKTSYQYYNRVGSLTPELVTPFSIQTGRTWMTDSQTTITESSILNNNLLPESIKISENGTLKRQRDFTYDSYGNILSVKEYPDISNMQEYIVSNIEYDDYTLPSKYTVNGVKNPDNQNISVNGSLSSSLEYDIMWNNIKEIGPSGLYVELTYDGRGRVTNAERFSSTGLCTDSVELVYDVDQNRVTYTDSSGEDYIYKYTGFGAIDNVINPLGIQTQKFDYDASGRIEKKYNAPDENTSNVTTYEYDELGRILRETTLATIWTPYIKIIAHEYNDIMNSNGDSMVSTYCTGLYEYEYSQGIFDSPTRIENYTIYDKYGRKIREGVVGGTEVSYTYDHLNRIIREQGPTFDNTYTYDCFGNVISVTNIDGNTCVNEYDSLGRVIHSTDYLGNETLYTYDVLGRIIEKKVQQSGTGEEKVYLTTKLYYDEAGNLVQKKTSSGSVQQPTWTTTSYVYDDIGQVVKISTGDIIQEYTYDDLGNVSTYKVGDATILYQYDAIGRLTSITDALGKSESYLYDDNNYLIQMTDRNGTVFNNHYSFFGQLEEEEIDSQYTKTYGYYGSGLLAEVKADNITQTYEYDSAGRLVEQNDPNSVRKTYSYNEEGLCSSYKLFTGNIQQINIGYTYDEAGRIENVSENNTVAVTYSYDANGNLASETRGNGICVNYTYNSANQPLSVANQIGNTILSAYEYTYGLDGNIVEKADSTGNNTYYVYNPQGMLSSESMYNGNVLKYQTTYSYDNRGNRISMSSIGENVYSHEYTYDLNNRLTDEHKLIYNENEESPLMLDTVYSYDDNGNLSASYNRSYEPNAYHQNSLILSMIDEDNSTSDVTWYTFNPLNQLISVQTEGMTAEYTYNPDGMRSSKTVNGVTTRQLWEGMYIIAETNSDGAITDKYVRGLRLLYNEKSDGEKIWHLNDAHGDTVQLANNTGEVIWNYSYDAFGNQLDNTSNNGEEPYNPFRYCGEYTDEETGFVYLRARYLNTETGRFISEDPIMDGSNWYAYCGNNPVMFVDPSGQLAWDMDAGYNLEGDYYANDNWSKTGYEIWDWETNWTGPDPGITYDESDPQWAKAAINYYRTQYEQAVGNNDHAKTKEAYAQIYTIKEYVANNTVPGAILDIEPITQQPYDMACVPTSLLMISNYYFPEDGYTLENMRQMLNKTLQYDVFRYGVFHDDHEKITRSTPFQCTLNSTYIIGEMVSFTDSDIVVSELKNSNPLMGIVYWENGNSHAVVICGYITVNSETGILYNDPWDGTQHYIPYYNFIVKNGFDGNGTLGSYFTTSK